MSANTPTRRGHKRGWRPLMGSLPPDAYKLLMKHLRATKQTRSQFVTDAVLEAMRAVFIPYERKGSEHD